MSALPTLVTRRLVLRPLQPEDAVTIAALGGQDFAVARWLTGCSWPYQEGDAESFVAEALAADPLTHEAVFAITLGGVMIGCISIEAPGDLDDMPDCPTLGYWLGSVFHGFGYATEAARAVLDWGFVAHDCQAIGARVFEENVVSRKVLRKLGFRPWGMTTRFARPLDRKVNCVVMRLERSADASADRTVA
ncbi:GNAT family N-acetyltransferase [Roseibium aestuarii]|uniref:GNAT family N-acetyltransferase n=1 Tax=Roseibium aestuarii TaxID=2600299 RepID=A0ABW4JWV2_9HYPH|nr:GNAT family N-acetyltransferase [Roseibium aestuarii]